MKKVLIIQTAFIGDVILATSLIELVRENLPQVEISFLLRAGNEVLLKDNPHIKNVFIWNKKQKYRSLFSLLKIMREMEFDYIFNLQRFFHSGLFTALLGGRFKSGFSQNPLSFLFDQKIKHELPLIRAGRVHHEVERNAELLPHEWRRGLTKPKLYFNAPASKPLHPYIILAPMSVWATKQWPLERWISLADKLVERDYQVYLVGGPGDYSACEKIKNGRENIINFAGKMSLHESADLMRGAVRVIANDSGTLHLASAVNAPSTGIFCSTTKSFGFYGLSDDSVTLEILDLPCKPCGIHGKVKCPETHFKCGFDISVEKVLETIKR